MSLSKVKLLTNIGLCLKDNSVSTKAVLGERSLHVVPRLVAPIALCKARGQQATLYVDLPLKCLNIKLRSYQYIVGGNTGCGL